MNVPAASLRRLLAFNLRLRRTDRLLVLADVRPGEARPATALAAALARAARGVCPVRFAVYPETGRNGVEPPAVAWRAAFGDAAVTELERDGLLGPVLAKRATRAQLSRLATILRRRRRDAPTAAIFVNSFSATHTQFRSGLTGAAGARVASCPGILPSMFGTALAVDGAALVRRTGRVAAALRRAVGIRVTSPDGTSLEFSAAGRPAHADDGLIRPGRVCNLPAGEAFMAPVEGTARGTLAVRVAPSGRLPSVMTFRIARGRATHVTGGGATGPALAALFRRHPEFAVVAEFGVGTNPGATLRTNILESEKILGTVHVAFGENRGFGGRNAAAFHQDFLVFRPTVTLVRGRGRPRRLLDAGRLLV